MTHFKILRHVKILLLAFLAISLSACSAQTATVPSQDIHTETNSRPNDLWQRLRDGFALEALENSEIKRNEYSYTKNPKFLYRITKRSERYLFYIVEEVERRGMPSEMALVPLVESAFNPNAKSRVNAVGLWQFIPTTGKSFGLKQDGWLDERQDITAATHAALDYLQKLHDKFGDWKLALAAYNWGQGSVSKSIERNRKKGLPENFHSIKLPIETRNHVHKLIAIRNIIANPENYGITLNTIPNRPYFKEIEAHYHMDKTLAAELADISIDEFNALNPAFKRAIVKVKDPPHILLLPVNKADTFQANLYGYEEPLISWQIHQLKKGESIHKISRRYQITEVQLQEANGIEKNEKIVYGQTILVPHASSRIDADISIVRKKPIFDKNDSQTSSRTDADISIIRKKPIFGKNNSQTSIYIVKKGDTLSGIAKRYGTTVRQIKRWNTENERLSIGQELILQHVQS